MSYGPSDGDPLKPTSAVSSEEIGGEFEVAAGGGPLTVGGPRKPNAFEVPQRPIVPSGRVGDTADRAPDGQPKSPVVGGNVCDADASSTAAVNTTIVGGKPLGPGCSK